VSANCFDDATGMPPGSQPKPPNQTQLPNSIPSRTDIYLEGVDSELQLEWSTYNATGVACEVMLTSVYPHSPRFLNEKTSETLRLYLEEAFSMSPGVARYGAIASICNGNLYEYYESNPPTEDQPARWFIPLGTSMSDRHLAQRSPDIVIVVRHLWEEHVRLQLEKIPISQRKDSNEWTKVFPDWEAVDGRIKNLLTNTSLLKADDLDLSLLRALAIHPPWECIVAIVEFNDSNTPDSTASISTPVNSSSTDISENEQQTASRSNGRIPEVTPVKSSKETAGSSPFSRHGTTPLASTDTNSPRHSSANEPFAPSSPPRKTSSPELQLLSYFCEVMSVARYRDWTSGVIISDMDFSLVTCDREGAIKSAPVSLGTADGVDIFSRWVLAVGSGPLAKSGFSNIFGNTAGKIDGVTFTIPDNAKCASEGGVQLKFGKLRYQQYGAFGRGTTLYCVAITKGDETIPGVCKISWPAASRES
jgi:Fungal protein kinase